MTDFLLIRHGEPAWSIPTGKGARGWGADLAPLTELGSQQIRDRLSEIRDFNPQQIIVSPTSRTLHSAALISCNLNHEFQVEFDLHEWIPHSSFTWVLEDVLKAEIEFNDNDGEWPSGQMRHWEPKSHVRERVLGVLAKYLSFSRVLVVCHFVVMNSLCGVRPNFAETALFSWNGES